MANKYIPLVIIVLLFCVENSIAQQSNLSPTQTNLGIAPLPLIKNATDSITEVIADFAADTTIIEAGNVIQFSNLSTGNPTYFQWTIEGGQPQISQTENPLIMFNTIGIYDVTLYVAGVNGDDDTTKTEYIEVIEPISFLPEGWEYSITLSQHTLVLASSINPTIFNVPIDSGDFIGVFHYNENNELKCAGAEQWDGINNIPITAQGDNFITSEKDGFAVGEEFNWKIFSQKTQEEYPAKAIYNQGPMQNMFVPNFFSFINGLSAGTAFDLEIENGWTAISSPVLPWEANLDSLLEPILQKINILYSDEGEFWPQGNINTIGEWKNSGYIVKMKNPATITFKGYQAEELSIFIQAGWNLIPVPVNCDTDIENLLGENILNVDIITELAGTNVFWPQYQISALNNLLPGKAYLLKANQEFELLFQPCE